MTSNINYKDNFFEWANITTIRGETTFEMLHKIRNKIKENAKSIYSNIGGVEHAHLVPALTDVQYKII